MPLKHSYSAETIERFYSSGHWSQGSLWQCAISHPAERLAVVDGNSHFTWGELTAMAEQTATALAQQGVGRGNVVGVQLPNSMHLVVMVMAVLRLGAVYHPLNPSYRQHDLARIFELSQPKVYVFPLRFRDFDYPQLAAGLKGSFAPIAVDLDGAPALPFGTGALPSVQTLQADDVFLIGATSGSTGAPKLYVHTQNTQKNEALVLNRELGLGPDDRFLATAPLTHRGALMFGLLTCLVAGAAIVLLREYRATDVLREIEAHDITAFMAIPAQVSDLLDLIEQQPGAGSSLHVLMVSGAPVQPALVRRLKAALSDCTPVTGYGTSETGYSFFTRPADSLERLQTCGRLMPGMEVRIDHGEVLLRGAFVFSGYQADETATREALDDEGWFHTGDIGQIDDNGYLVVTGRQKNVIIRAGLKIQAEEMEYLLNLHPQVRQCALVPVPDERLGERAVLFVVPHTGAAPTLDDLRGFLNGKGVAKFKWPEGLKLVPVLPVNAIGKLDRLQLRSGLALSVALQNATGLTAP
jgi:cyclohexanecarboxylate-CoA ligase